jgi:hypothetical protein
MLMHAVNTHLLGFDVIRWKRVTTLLKPRKRLVIVVRRVVDVLSATWRVLCEVNHITVPSVFI